MSRQKILTIIVLSLAGLTIGRSVVMSMIVRPYRDLGASIERKESELTGYDADIALQWASLDKWREFGARTLGTEAHVAQNRFDGDLKSLLQSNKLSKAAVRPKTHRRLKNGLVLVPFSVQAQGGLANVVQFLTAFYERPYLARITSLNLAPVSSKKQSVLVMRLDAETVVLPDTKLSGAVRAMDQDEGSFEQRKRYAADGKEALAMLTQKHLFERWVKPPPEPTVVKTRPKAAPPTKPKAPKPEPPKPKPRPPDPSVIVALLSYPGHGEVVTLHPGTKVRTVHYLGEEMAGGKLVMVHPLGAVVGIEDEYWVLPNGAKVDDENQRVLATEVPQVMRKLAPLLEEKEAEGQPVDLDEVVTPEEESTSGEEEAEEGSGEADPEADSEGEEAEGEPEGEDETSGEEESGTAEQRAAGAKLERRVGAAKNSTGLAGIGRAAQSALTRSAGPSIEAVWRTTS